jgi:hypothetical protein
MSDDDKGGGERNFLSDWDDGPLAIALSSGDGDKVARRTGVEGTISTGAPRELCELVF